ncbi:MAG TPA: MFS transporter [bacterium]|nr:MFS transporter [bacterium]HQI47722.1 MFS transporter [bacterium]HQJ64083.1 MFS transporter [bacterium]
MAEKLHRLLSDSKGARWTALLIVSFTMFAGYYMADLMAPLQVMLQKQLGWSATDYGWYTGAYGWFNVFLFFLIIGGIILDKMGVRFTGLTAAIVMVGGALIKYWAITTQSLTSQSWHILFWTFPAQVWMAALGYAIFGVGVEVAGITVSKVIVKWFKGHELALAMGLQLAIARMGTALALSTSLPISKHFNTVSAPLLICLVMLCIGLLAFFVYTFNDKRLDASLATLHGGSEKQADEEFHLSDIGAIIGNRGWWYLAILCALFYSAVFPFLKYATGLMINKYHVSENLAGLIPGLLPFGTILLTPLFGNLYDRKGKGATIMILGAVLIILVHSLFAVPAFSHWTVAVLLMIILGIAFSLVPSAMWPSLAKIIPEKRLGSAYALVFWIQNMIALMFIPAMIGWVLDHYCIASQSTVNGVTTTVYSYTLPMILFAVIGVLSLIFAFLLKMEDSKKGYGLQLPNIKS